LLEPIKVKLLENAITNILLMRVLSSDLTSNKRNDLKFKIGEKSKETIYLFKKSNVRIIGGVD